MDEDLKEVGAFNQEKRGRYWEVAGSSTPEQVVGSSADLAEAFPEACALCACEVAIHQPDLNFTQHCISQELDLMTLSMGSSIFGRAPHRHRHS